MSVRVRDIMDKNPVVIDINLTVFGLREVIILRRPECVLVTDKKKHPVGILTPAQLASISDADVDETVESIMENRLKVVGSNMSIREAAAMLSASAFDALPVVNSDKELVGVITNKDIVKDFVDENSDKLLTPESAVIYLAMIKDSEQEEYWLDKVSNKGYRAAITQVGATAEKLPIKLREATIVASIARSVIKEDSREKFSVSNAVRDIYSQLYTVNPGLGGGFKVAIVRGEGRIAIAAFGRCGHALSNGNEQIFMGSNII